MIFLETTLGANITWHTNPTPLPYASAGHGTVLYDNKIYILGGTPGPDLLVDDVYYAEIFSDGTVGSWIPTTNLPAPRTSIQYSVARWNNFIYVVGGQAGGAPPGERYSVWFTEINSDGSLGSWMTTSSIPWRRRNHFVVVWNGRIYVGGGTDGYGWRADVAYAEIDIDGSLGSWTPTASLPLSYGAMGALVHNGRIYLIGGTSTWGGPGLSHNDVFYAAINPDGSIGSWTTTASLPDRREHVGVGLLGDSIYATGGLKTPEITLHDTVYKAVINLDGSIDSWEELQNLPEPREAHTSVTFAGRIYVIGGYFNEYKDTIYFSSSIKIQAAIDIDPNTLNLKSKGKWITCYIELPEGYNVSDIDVSTIKLNNSIAAEIHLTGVGDEDGDGVPDLMVKFDRASVIYYIVNNLDWATPERTKPLIYAVNLTVTGNLYNGTPFEGTDTIRVLKFLKGHPQPS